MKMVGFENWINVIFATSKNIFIQLTTSKMITLSLIYTHVKDGNTYTINIIDIVTIPALWLIGR